MSDNERRPRLHIHFGGLIILIIIFLILFRVDLKSKINSPQFQKNYTYITEQIGNFWHKYILDPIKLKLSNFIIDQTNTKINDFQNNFKNKIYKNLLIEDNIIK
jgi:hypothetical protein